MDWLLLHYTEDYEECAGIPRRITYYDDVVTDEEDEEITQEVIEDLLVTAYNDIPF